ncbi:MAG TPA: hypothetical protein VGC30_04835, partial [Dokdonella sp.]
MAAARRSSHVEEAGSFQRCRRRPPALDSGRACARVGAVIADRDIALAVRGDARRIAMMSRDLVEHGLGWRWTEPRILRVMRDAAINVVVARDKGEIAGFAIMQYKDDEAHLLLL